MHQSPDALPRPADHMLTFGATATTPVKILIAATLIATVVVGVRQIILTSRARRASGPSRDGYISVGAAHVLPLGLFDSVVLTISEAHIVIRLPRESAPELVINKSEGNVLDWRKMFGQRSAVVLRPDDRETVIFTPVSWSLMSRAMFDYGWRLHPVRGPWL